MIKRIVKLTFRPDAVNDFLDLFQNNRSTIAGFEGCHHLELLREHPEGTVFFTLSHWESEQTLEAYRHSDFFRDTWAKTKKLFAERPEAWTVTVVG